jgi:hypothetical protein
MSQTSPTRRISVPQYKIDDMTLQEIEKELFHVYGIRAPPGINRGHLATVLAEHREDSASQLHESSSPISNPYDMTSQQIMHELFYVYGEYAPDLNQYELAKRLVDYREGLIQPNPFLDPSVMTKRDMQYEISIHFKLNRIGLNRMTADFIRTLRNISPQAYVQSDDK